jgi:hypothetical protein
VKQRRLNVEETKRLRRLHEDLERTVDGRGSNRDNWSARHLLLEEVMPVLRDLFPEEAEG